LGRRVRTVKKNRRLSSC